MHVLAVHSVLTLLNHLKDQLNNTPTLEMIQSFAEEAKQDAELLDKDPEEVCNGTGGVKQKLSGPEMSLGWSNKGVVL